MHRLLRHLKNVNIWLEECRKFFDHLRAMGYPVCAIDATFRRFSWNQRGKLLDLKVTSKANNFSTLYYGWIHLLQHKCSWYCAAAGTYGGEWLWYLSAASLLYTEEPQTTESRSLTVASIGRPTLICERVCSNSLERVWIYSWGNGFCRILTGHTDSPEKRPSEKQRTNTKYWWWLDCPLKYRNWKHSRTTLRLGHKAYLRRTYLEVLYTTNEYTWE